MIGTVVNIFRTQDLRNRILLTMALLMISRVGYHISNPGFDQNRMTTEMETRDTHDLFEGFRVFTGCTWGRNCLFALGFMPYISASICMMLLAEVIPTLKRLRQEGQTGHKKIKEYTWSLTVLVCIAQAIMYMKMLDGSAYPGMQVQAYIMGIIGMTAGTVFLMWLGEQIDEYGIGCGGIYLIVTAGIISGMPGIVNRLIHNMSTSDGMSPAKVVFLLLAFIVMVATAILIVRGQRRIPIQQAESMRGRRMFGGQRHYLPLRVNHGGVMPILFASGFIIFPRIIMNQLAKLFPNSDVLQSVASSLRPGTYVHIVIYMLLIFLFAYWWVTVQFQPREMAKNLRDSGSYIPGLRPGRRTADYLETVMDRITYWGAALLAVIAIIPAFLSYVLGIHPSIAVYLGGVRLLFVVGNLLELVQKIEARILMVSNYFRRLKKDGENSSLAE